MKLTLYFLLILALVTPQFIRADDSKGADNDAEVTTEEDSEKKDDEKSEEEEEAKEIKLDETALWKNMDLDKDGKITVAEYEQFSSSPQARAYVQQMKSKIAIEEWAKEHDIDVETARKAMNVGITAQWKQQYVAQQQRAQYQAAAQRAAIARRQRQIAMARQQQQNYWSRLGQMYYQAMQRRGGRTEL